MKRTLCIAVALAILVAVPFYAQLNAVVKEFSGKVEVKPSGGSWTPVASGMVLENGTTVSTGFGSRLVLEIGLSRVTVAPVTRLLLEDIVKRENTNSSSLVLKVGKVNAQVKSAAGEKSEFTLKGPASTAAVRGTEFDFDGFTLNVTDGVVQFLNLLSQMRPVGAGESSTTNGYSFPTSGETGNQQNSSVDKASTGGVSGEGGQQEGGGGTNPPVVTGTVTVTLQ